jgi:hypothetical protein
MAKLRIHKLGELLYYKLSQAVKMTGSYDPDKALPFIEESLTPRDYDMLYMFLSWVHKNNLTFGSANYEKVFKEWQEDMEYQQDEREAQRKERNFTQGTE